MTDEAAPEGHPPVTPLDAVPLSRLYSPVTPTAGPAAGGHPRQRLGAAGPHWRVPRSSLAPILRFADVEAFVQQSKGGGKDGTQLDGFVQVGVAKEDQPHYLKVLARPDADSRPRYSTGRDRGTGDASRAIDPLRRDLPRADL